jgi:Na+-transporting methylmalonyl-CoA/oxaloacetate decarboxylase gamma subunit
VTELGIVYLFLALLALFVLVGALLPRYLPGLIRLLDATVLKEEHGSDGHTERTHP